MSERVVVITGASAGIGAALARQLGQAGDAVVLVARRADVLRATAVACGPRAHAIVADVTDRVAVRRVVAESLAALGHVDVWVNNAGRGITRSPFELDDDDIDAMMLANVKSALYGMQEILPHFQERGAGHIVNVSSLLGRMPYVPFRSAYTGAKHFLNALTANVRDELRQRHPGIQVSLVSPGVVRTEFGVSALHGGPDSRALPQSQSAEGVAAVIAEVIDSRRADVYTRAGVREQIAKYYTSIGEDP